ncbi:hypothetical protein TNCV_824891 [Trichonephila clavipes]|nr:hypothetical protein TNCV_824891 [Trichonephila clavipes]
MSTGFSLDLLRLRAKTAWSFREVLDSTSGQPDCTLSAAVLPWRPENLKHTKKTEQTRTIRQMHKDLTYHNSVELDSFSIM